MKIQDIFSTLLASAIALYCQNNISFIAGEESCPSGTVDDGSGSCVNPYYDGGDDDKSSLDDDEEEDSSDDYSGGGQYTGNPHAHIDEEAGYEQASCD